MKKTFRDGWFKTISDTNFNLLEPSRDSIFLDDIIHSLSMTNRFAGHTIRPYSVAEHLCRCCDIATETFSEDVQREALIHDFAEAYYQDIMSPIKLALGIEYKKKETRCQQLINEKLLGYQFFRHSNIVERIDFRMLVTECRDLTEQEAWWEAVDTYEYTIPKTEYHWTFWRDCLVQKLKNRFMLKDNLWSRNKK